MILPRAQAASTMSETFDPYRKWLGIPPKDQPPNHYRLLGIAHFEDDPDVIENAATRQIAHVRTFQSGKHSALSQRILNELTSAKLCLLQAEKKVPYDDHLRSKLAAEGKLSSDNLLVTSEVIQESPTYDAPPAYDSLQPEMPEIKRNFPVRWKTDAEDVRSAEPPIVPIPMPLGIAVAAPPRLSPPIPLAPAPLMISGSRRSYRSKKSSASSLPIAIAIIGLLLIFGGGIAAVALSGALSKPTEKPLKKSAVSVSRPPPRPTPLEFPLNSAKTSVGKPDSEPPKKQPRGQGTVEDELRSEVFLGRQALEKRDADRCKTHVVTVENLLVTNPQVDSKLKEQVQLLRELLNLNGEFWSLVRDAAINGKVAAGEKFKFHKEEFELVSHEGDLVSYKAGGREHTAPLMEIHAKAALALAFRSTQNDEGKRLAMLAFGMVDKQSVEEHFDRNWAKNLYLSLARAGHTNALLARELKLEDKPNPAKTKIPAEDEEMPALDKPAADKPDSK